MRYLVAACMTMSAPSVSGRVQYRRGDGGIDTAQMAPAAMGDLGDGGDVGDASTVGLDGVSSQTSFVLARLDRSLHGGEVGRVDEGRRVAVGDGVVHQPVAQRPVHHGGRDDVSARRQGHDHGCRRRHARSQHQRLGAFLKGCQNGLALAHCLVVRAAVDEAVAVLVVGVADEGGRDVDRRHDGVGFRLLPAEGLGGERARLEAGGLGCGHGLILETALDPCGPEGRPSSDKVPSSATTILI